MMILPEDVPGVPELFTDNAIAGLAGDQNLFARVSAMQEREKALLSLPDGTDDLNVHRACQAYIAQMLDGKEAKEIKYAAEDPAAFVRSIGALPRLPRTAKQRRRAREAARIYLCMYKGSLFIPQETEEFHRLWELAMNGEPRWSDDYPSSAFRTGKATILGSFLKQNVLQVCSDPDDIDRELTELIGILALDHLLPEIRAICAFAMFEWIHPFADGNGHTGRMLMLAALSRYYSLASVTCFSSELLMEKYRTTKAFALLRSGEGDLNDFCSAVLSQLEDAQLDAVDLLQKGSLSVQLDI